MKKEHIIALIIEDINHNQLLNGLEDIGLTDNEKYTSGIVWLVADMMNIEKGKVPENWLETYYSTMLNVLHNLDPDQRKDLAEKLFQKLLSLT